MTAPIVRRARKGEVRCKECKHFETVYFPHSILWFTVDLPVYGCFLYNIGEETRRNNTCAYAQKREGEA